MGKPKSWVAVPAAMLWVCGVLGAADAKQPMIGEPAPAFQLESLEGKRVALQEFKGKFVVLHFGTGW